MVTDRYIGSSLAYQGYGRGLSIDELTWLSTWATRGQWPDLIVLLDVPHEVAASRLDPTTLDRFEAAGTAFHERVRRGFTEMAAAEPSRWLVIDGTGAVDRVTAKILSGVHDRLGLRV